MGMELDAAVLAKARAGDRVALTRFVEVYQARVYAVCLAFAGADAEDLAQETFVRALRRLRDFDPRGPARLSTFVLRIARNLCIDRARSARVRLPHDGDAERIADSTRLDHQLIDAQDAELLRRAVLALPDDQRAAVALSAWGELDYAEVAAIEGVPVGTIRSRLSRARDALHTALAAHDEVANAG